MQPVRPFLLPGAHALQVLRERVAAAVAGWAAAWAGAGSAARVEVHAVAGTAAVALPCRHHAGAEGELWLAAASGTQDPLPALVLGAAFASPAGHDDDWSQRVVRRARQALDLALAEALLGGPVVAGGEARPDAALFLPGSGAVHFACAELGWQAWASGAVLRHVPPRAAAASPGPAPVPLLPLVQGAAARQPVRLAVEAGSVELELGRLLGLQPGDVLRLPTRLDQPLWLCGPQGEALARCALGERDGRRAVRVVPQS